jgi:hypothetical protein
MSIDFTEAFVAIGSENFHKTVAFYAAIPWPAARRADAGHPRGVPPAGASAGALQAAGHPHGLFPEPAGPALTGAEPGFSDRHRGFATSCRHLAASSFLPHAS